MFISANHDNHKIISQRDSWSSSFSPRFFGWGPEISSVLAVDKICLSFYWCDIAWRGRCSPDLQLPLIGSMSVWMSSMVLGTGPRKKKPTPSLPESWRQINCQVLNHLSWRWLLPQMIRQQSLHTKGSSSLWVCPGAGQCTRIFLYIVLIKFLSKAISLKGRLYAYTSSKAFLNYTLTPQLYILKWFALLMRSCILINQ